MTIMPRDWDSRFFCYAVASVVFSSAEEFVADCSAALAEARHTGIRLLYVSCPPLSPDQYKTAKRLNLTPVGQRVEFSKRLPLQDGPEREVDAGISICSDTSPALEQLALQSGHHSRFRLDPRFRHQEFERLYAEWLISSLRGDDGKCVLVAGAPATPHGFITLEPGKIAHIGLLAVDAALRGAGLGRRLVAEAERFSAARGSTHLQVATQGGNQPARRLYERCGFMQIEALDQFHAWFPAEPGQT